LVYGFLDRGHESELRSAQVIKAQSQACFTLSGAPQ
jgi:hypothetical protein